jgi:hypothetical protein
MSTTPLARSSPEEVPAEPVLTDLLDDLTS